MSPYQRWKISIQFGVSKSLARENPFLSHFRAGGKLMSSSNVSQWLSAVLRPRATFSLLGTTKEAYRGKKVCSSRNSTRSLSIFVYHAIESRTEHDASLSDRIGLIERRQEGFAREKKTSFFLSRPGFGVWERGQEEEDELAKHKQSCTENRSIDRLCIPNKVKTNFFFLCYTF